MNKLMMSYVLTGMILIGLAATAGCASMNDEPTQAAVYYSFQDDHGAAVTLAKKPERIVILTPQFLPMLYELGGEAVGYATSNVDVLPEGAERIQQVGAVNQINVEQLTALSPDLVIGSTTFDEKLIDVMNSNHIPLALLRMASFDDVKEKARLMGAIIGAEDRAEQLIAQTEAKMEAIRSQLPEEQPTFGVLNVTSNTISIQRANTTALEVGGLLNMTNIAESMNPSPNSATSAPYSIETLVAVQPDYLFIVIHGSEEKGRLKIKEELENNPAWASLQAVREERTHVLPADRFLINPGFAYDESMIDMARLIYPEIFGHAEH